MSLLFLSSHLQMMKIATPAVTETKSSMSHILTHPLPDVSVGDDNKNIIKK
ncbi:hypothetical protein [Catonella morbi]|uniref:hypothetical protein n=1 Tax=Catonella morbi TaxID=43997 RepID=UPI0012EBF0DD|nr:hypothetical protein [Catonella morbi]